MSTLDDRTATLLAKPSLEGLSYALRHPEVWPERYARAGWHFPDCDRCAMGLAFALWERWDVHVMFGLTPHQAFDLFGMPLRSGHPYRGLTEREITAVNVADNIDAFVASCASVWPD